MIRSSYGGGNGAMAGEGQGTTRMLQSRVDRRSFLRRSVGTVGASVLFAPRITWSELQTQKKLKTAFRLSSGDRACHACKAGNANRFYRTFNAANLGRSHLGCNCRIVTQDIKSGIWSCYFRGGKTSVYDLRWARPKCPPP